jgi:spore germination protein
MIKALLIIALLAASASAQSIHQLDYDKHTKSNEELISSPAPAYKTARPNTLAKQSYGFHPYWATDADAKDYRWDLLTTIAYFGAELDPRTGNISATNKWRASTIIDSAHAHGVGVHLTAILFEQHDSLLGVPARRANAIAKLLALAKERNAEGINIDFEAVPGRLRDSVTKFVRELRLTAGPEFGIVLDLPAIDWNNAFDVVALQQILDHFFLMAYDYHWHSGPTAGPVAPLDGVGLSIKNSLSRYDKKGLDKSKLILGSPWYGYDWPTVSDAKESDARASATSLTTDVAVVRAETYGRRYDIIAESPYYVYETGESVHQTWYDDPASLGVKYQYGMQQGLAGIGYWALSYASSLPQTWTVIEDAIGSKSSVEREVEHEQYDSVPDGAADVVYYDIAGRRVSEPQVGLYFVRFNFNGSVHQLKTLHP